MSLLSIHQGRPKSVALLDIYSKMNMCLVRSVTPQFEDEARLVLGDLGVQIVNGHCFLGVLLETA